MYNLIWRSVTCRPGNGGLLSGVKRPIIAQTIATARRCDPIKDHTVASVVPPIGLRPHSGTTLATLSHPDCRSVLTLIVAGQAERVGGRRLTFRLDGVEPALNPRDPPVNPFQALVDLSDDLVQDQDLLACVDDRLVQGRLALLQVGDVLLQDLDALEDAPLEVDDVSRPRTLCHSVSSFMVVGSPLGPSGSPGVSD